MTKSGERYTEMNKYEWFHTDEVINMVADFAMEIVTEIVGRTNKDSILKELSETMCCEDDDVSLIAKDSFKKIINAIAVYTVNFHQVIEDHTDYIDKHFERGE